MAGRNHVWKFCPLLKAAAEKCHQDFTLLPTSYQGFSGPDQLVAGKGSHDSCCKTIFAQRAFSKLAFCFSRAFSTSCSTCLPRARMREQRFLIFIPHVYPATLYCSPAHRGKKEPKTHAVVKRKESSRLKFAKPFHPLGRSLK